jgi:6-pyruvoyl-tetrahydropterin synthase
MLYGEIGERERQRQIRLNDFNRKIGDLEHREIGDREIVGREIEIDSGEIGGRSFFLGVDFNDFETIFSEIFSQFSVKNVNFLVNFDVKINEKMLKLIEKEAIQITFYQKLKKKYANIEQEIEKERQGQKESESVSVSPSYRILGYSFLSIHSLLSPYGGCEGQLPIVFIPHRTLPNNSLSKSSSSSSSLSSSSLSIPASLSTFLANKGLSIHTAPLRLLYEELKSHIRCECECE